MALLETTQAMQEQVSYQSKLPQMTSGPPKTIFAPKSLAKYWMSPPAYLEEHKHEIDHLVVGAIVVHDQRILLIQRSRLDYGGLCWEIPGGMCETHDESILDAACRELWEEAGMRAVSVTDLVEDSHAWTDPNGSRWRKITFMIDVEKDVQGGLKVKLDPAEHEDYVWVDKKHVLEGSAWGRRFKWTSNDQMRTVLKAFDLL